MDPFAGPPDKRRAFDDAGQSNGVQRDRTCKRYDTPEGCPFGDRCRFSHGADDPRFKGAANGASQKQPCQKFFSTNGCPYGDTCHFTHYVSGPPPRIIVGSGQSAAAAPLPSYRAPEPDQGRQNMKTRMCKNFQEGNCTFGERCHFAHGNQEMRAGPPRSAPPTGFTSTMAPEGSGVKEFPLLWGESTTDAAGNVTMMATITFPQDMAGSIIGKGGQNVRQIQVTSGAKVTLKPSPADPTNLKDVDIEGTGAAVQSAASLIQRTLADKLNNPGGSRPGAGAASPFFKTRMCEKFMQGACTFGDKCHFAHGPADLRTRTDQPAAYGAQPAAYGGPAQYQPGPPGGVAAY